MHWLMAALYSTNSAADLRGLRPRDSRRAQWALEWERLERANAADSSGPRATPWWRSALRPALRSRLS